MINPEPARYRHDELEILQRRVEAARVAAGLAGQGHGVAGAQDCPIRPTAGVFRCRDPVLPDGEGVVRPSASANDGNGGQHSGVGRGLTGRCPTSRP